jgi:hypothetical protein
MSKREEKYRDMLVEKYGPAVSHIESVINSCETYLQLLKAYLWGVATLDRFLAFETRDSLPISVLVNRTVAKDYFKLKKDIIGECYSRLVGKFIFK